MILSVSRRTDIPAFYSEWFYNRIKAGFVYVRNPINKNLISKVVISPDIVDCIVFWTKNPEPFIKNLEKINNYKYYFQFTVNSYNSLIEKNVPQKTNILKTFSSLSNEIGKEKVFWRYDPIFLAENIDIEYHIKYFKKIAEKLAPYTNKCTISFVDIYKKCEINLKQVAIKEPCKNDIETLASEFSKIAFTYNINIETCAEKIDLIRFGIGHGKCIDEKIIEEIINHKIKYKKDKNQRQECDCIESIDIGEYNTCQHSCLYCYANYSQKTVSNYVINHNQNSPLLIGNVKDTDVIKEKNTLSLKTDFLF